MASDVRFSSAVELARLVHRGEVAPRELVDASLRAIEAEGGLGAFTDVEADRALAAAEMIAAGDNRPLAGVPVAIKGNVAAKGLVVDHGSRLLAGRRADHDAYLVRRLRDAGAIVVGTTRLPEFGILPTTEPRHGGPARNPWDRERTPGGSSGGSAAAVAAGLLPLAHGTDGAGSIRIPAACCGLVGLKPSRGRISRGPDQGDSLLVADGVLTRTVADTALALDVLCGYEVGDSTWTPRPNPPLRSVVGRHPGPLRIAVSGDNALGAPLDEENARAVRDAAEALAGFGHQVEEVDVVPIDGETLTVFLRVFGANPAAALAAAREQADRDPEEGDVEPLSRALHDQAAAVSAVEYLTMVRRLQSVARRTVAFFADWDVLLTPVLAQRPLPIGACHGWMDDPLAAMGVAAAFAPYCAVYNLTGQPAISVPSGFGPDGLPSAVQIVGPPLGEDTLLQLAGQLEAARPWVDRRPPAPVTAL